MVELIDLVNSVTIFLCQTNLLRWLTFLLGSQIVILTFVLFLDLFFSSDASICSTMAFSPLENSDHVVVSVFINFPSDCQQDALSHCIAYDYSRADWDSLCYLLLVNFVIGFKLELMYISLIVSIKSNPTHLHGFQWLVLLQEFIEITFFVCTNRINLLNLT